jgi:hypothetical protein
MTFTEPTNFQTRDVFPSAAFFWLGSAHAVQPVDRELAPRIGPLTAPAVADS